MPGSFPTPDPIRNPNFWMYFTLQGVKSPGTIPRGGVRGFERETGWDIKHGKGTQGATLTLTTQPPVRGTITLQLFTPQDFANWDAFVANVLSIAPDKQQAEGLPIFYPQFASIGLVTVVVAKYGSPTHQGKGLYTVNIELIEWQPPPPVSVVSTVAATKPDQPEADVPAPVDPRIAALQQQIALLNQSSQNP